ncbi:MAG: pentapeptide repeat-containing protein, partial [Nitrospinota bacterium]|nr:pentapeptide repeat-containing protein [Nitrospinota bacterium]
MHSLRPCLTVFVIVFALCVGATQSTEGYNQEHLERLKETKKCRKCDLRGAVLFDEYLLGADLSGADLQDANLTDTELTGTNLSNVNLRGANLLGADLSDATLLGANLTGVKINKRTYLIGVKIDENTIVTGVERLIEIRKRIEEEKRKLSLKKNPGYRELRIGMTPKEVAALGVCENSTGKTLCYNLMGERREFLLEYRQDFLKKIYIPLGRYMESKWEKLHRQFSLKYAMTKSFSEIDRQRFNAEKDFFKKSFRKNLVNL